MQTGLPLAPRPVLPDVAWSRLRSLAQGLDASLPELGRDKGDPMVEGKQPQPFTAKKGMITLGTSPSATKSQKTCNSQDIRFLRTRSLVDSTLSH